MVVVALVALVLALGPAAAAQAGPVVSLGDSTVMEPASGTRGAFVPVFLSRPATEPVVVTFHTVAGSAAAGQDFSVWGTPAAPRTVTIPAGSVQGSVNVPVLADGAVEDDEAFTVVATAVSGGGAVLGGATGTATVLDPDQLGSTNPVLAVTGGRVVEGDEGVRRAQFLVQLSEPVDTALSVAYGTRDGTAVAPGDYTAKLPGTVRFTPGALLRVVDVQVPADRSVDGDRDFSLDLTVTGGPAVEELAMTGTAVVDDDDVANAEPVAALTATPPAGTAPLAVTLDASGSSDPDGTLASVVIDPGDGTTPVTATTLAHTYGPGTWTATTTVTDSSGATATTSATVTVAAPLDTTPLSVGPTYACALAGGGGVRCWGRNDTGQLGDGTTTDRSRPVTVAGLTGAVQVDAAEPAGSFGVNTTCARRSDLTAWCWGSSTLGLRGNGGAPTTAAPSQVSLAGVAEVSVGNIHACARTTDGRAHCWGWGTGGRLGNGDTSNTVRESPVQVPGLTGVVDVDAGSFHSCAVLADGTVRCWGLNGSGNLGTGDTTSRPSPTAVVGLADAVAVDVGTSRTCALRRGGTVACWGSGPLGNGAATGGSLPVAVSGLTTATQVSAGDGATCALLAAGTVSCWGQGGGVLASGSTTTALVPTPVPGFTGVSHVSTNGQYQSPGTGPVTGSRNLTCFLAAGTWCSGANEFGQLGNGASTDTLVPVRANIAPTAVVTASPTTGPAPLTVQFDSAGSSDEDGTVVSRAWDFGDGATSTAAAPSHTYTTPGTKTVTLTVTDDSGATGVATRTITPDVPPPAAVPLAAGTGHACSVSAGIVRCWGDNASGQLGDGTTTDRPLPTPVVGITDAVAVTAGASHTCAVLADTTVRCWGSGAEGRLGNGGTASSSTPVVVSGLSEVLAIDADVSTCAVVAGGGVRCWGLNTAGQLGSGSTDSWSTVPTSVAGLTDAVEVAVGSNHACALRIGGALRCWGGHSSGQLGSNLIGPGLYRTPQDVIGISDAVDVAAGSNFSCAVRAGGSAACWGSNGQGTLGDGNTSNANLPSTVALLSGAVGITAGTDHVCARTAAALWCWGSNGEGRLGSGSLPTGTTGVARMPVQVVGGPYDLAAPGGRHTCAVTSGGSVQCWGALGDGQLGIGVAAYEVLGTTPQGTSAATQVDADGCAVLAGTVRCWGPNTRGRVGNGTTGDHVGFPALVVGLTDADAVSTGANHSCARRADSSVRCWGSNTSGQLGDGTTADSAVPVDVVGLAPALSIQVGASHTCALLVAGTVSCWGDNSTGQLGNGTTTASPTPVPVTGLAGMVRLSVGSNHSCAVRSDGAVRCWGAGGSGRLGDGGSVNRTTPVAAVGLTDAVAVAAGSDHSCAVRSGGGVRCWGSRSFGALGDGRTDNSSPEPVDVLNVTGALDVTAANGHACARTATSVWCWGYGFFGQLGQGTTQVASALPVVASRIGSALSVSVGGQNTCAVLPDSVRCWGKRSRGSLGDGFTDQYPSPQPVVGLP